MTTLREAAQQALEALEDINGWQSLAPPLVSQAARRTAVNLRAALEQPEQEPEPVEWVESPFGDVWKTPPRREWQSLTDEEINEATFHADERMNTHLEFARALEQALKEKNYDPA